jgi:hypothetical protein
MLKLLYAISCENAIVSEDGITSLVNILERISTEVATETPDKMLIGMRWAHVSFWTRDEAEVPEPIVYEQRTLVISAEGLQVFDAIAQFTVSNDHQNYRNIIRMNGFPITSGGKVRVEVHLRKQGDENWEKYGEFPILTELIVSEVSDGNKTQVQHIDNEVGIES